MPTFDEYMQSGGYQKDVANGWNLTGVPNTAPIVTSAPPPPSSSGGGGSYTPTQQSQPQYDGNAWGDKQNGFVPGVGFYQNGQFIPIGGGQQQQPPPQQQMPQQPYYQQQQSLTPEYLTQLLGSWQTSTQNQWQDIVGQITKANEGNKSYTDQLFKQFQDMLSAQNDATSQRWDAERLLAEEQAKKQAEEKRRLAEQLIGSLTGNQKYELDSLANNANAAKASLEDQTFQQWIQTRQGLVNDGIQDSGLASDAQTRLMLGRDKSMANLYAQNQTNVSDITRKYGDKLSEAQRGLSDINESDIAAENFRNLFAEGSKSMTEQSKVISDLINKTLPYSQMKPEDLMSLYTNLANTNSKDQQSILDKIFNYDKMGVENQQFYNKLSSEEQRFYDKLDVESRQFYAKLDQDDRKHLDEIGFKYDNLNADTQMALKKLEADDLKSLRDIGFKYDQLSAQEKREWAKLDSNEMQFYAKLKQDYALDMTKVMGVDEKGNPTLDAQKLIEQIRSNQAGENIDMAKLAETMRNNNMVNAIGYDRLTADVTKWTEELKLKADSNELDWTKLAQKTEYDNAMIDKASAQAQNDTQRTILDGLKTQLNSVSKQLEAQTKNGAKPNAATEKQYKAIMDAINNTVLGK